VIGLSGRTQSPDAHLHFDAQSGLGCFNTYACQVDYGTVGWCGPAGWRTTDSARLEMGRSLSFGPCRS
jgi:hypothetical protein